MARDVRRAPLRVNLGLAAVALALSGVAGWAWTGRAAALEEVADRQAATQAAATLAVNLVSVDHRTIDSTLGRILATSTGEAREDYQATLKDATVRNKVLQTGVLRATGLTSMNPARTSAEALVVADAVISWADRDDPPEERFYRWRMTLAKVSGKWLVSKAELVQ
ncbi:hypothetical protein [Acrocarpospora catenulata]|uniref:hypothetical protein n=1 Tax=Acrocarpospora catenulata TaxID=2836182 RepID=UPI0027DFE3F0|nr:hypothetical protein [Acrocarpospora catenulata]